MREQDFNRFSTVLNATMDVYGRERNGTAMALWWKALEGFSVEQVEAGLACHIKTSRFAPTPADVVAAICATDGRPTADEAWAMIPRSEAQSVIWTDEMSAAYGIAAPLLGAGDAVAARRAFIDAYESAVTKARASGRPIKAWPSWGWDAAGRESAVVAAVERGLLSREQAATYLPMLPNANESGLPALLGDLAKRMTLQ